jgi:hypothetical protein
MKIIKYGDGASSRPHESFVIKNSETIFIGGTVKLVAGAVEPADAVNDFIYGICVGIVGKNNTPYANLLSGEKGTDTFTAGTSIAVDSDNETVAGIRAKVVPLMPNDIVRAEADAALGTTTGSDEIGYYLNVLTTDERKLDESSASETKEQFLSVGIPDVPGNFIDVKLVEGQIFGQ